MDHIFPTKMGEITQSKNFMAVYAQPNNTAKTTEAQFKDTASPKIAHLKDMAPTKNSKATISEELPHHKNIGAEIGGGHASNFFPQHGL